MITNLMIMTPRDTPGDIASRKVGQSHFFMATDNTGEALLASGREPLALWLRVRWILE